jgi:hypothetical protein
MRCGLAIMSVALLAGLPVLAANQTPEERAETVLTKSPIIDGHNDTAEQIREFVNTSSRSAGEDPH